MAHNTRFIKSVTEAAKAEVPPMPWARGARRQAFIAKRKALAIKRLAA